MLSNNHALIAGQHYRMVGILYFVSLLVTDPMEQDPVPTNSYYVVERPVSGAFLDNISFKDSEGKILFVTKRKMLRRGSYSLIDQATKNEVIEVSLKALALHTTFEIFQMPSRTLMAVVKMEILSQLAYQHNFHIEDANNNPIAAVGGDFANWEYSIFDMQNNTIAKISRTFPGDLASKVGALFKGTYGVDIKSSSISPLVILGFVIVAEHIATNQGGAVSPMNPLNFPRPR